MTPRHALAVGLIVLAANLIVWPLTGRLGGLSVDTLFWLRDTAFGPRHAPADSPTAVIAIDEETYRRPPFQHLPNVMWAKEIARVINALLDADVRRIAFDIVFPTSVEKGMPGHDRPLLLALRRASRDGRIVLGKVQHQVKPISPFPGYSFAVGHQRNIRPLNVIEDADGVIRRIPLFFRSKDLKRGERVEPSMALELASRAIGARPARSADGTVLFNGREVPARDGGPLVNFDGGAGWIPAYPLVDLHACAEKGDTAYFRRHFAGKTVLLGAVLDSGDRKLTSRRFINRPEGVNRPPRCALAPMPGIYRAGVTRNSIPGVFIHATAVNMLLRGETLSEPGPWLRAAIVLALTALAAVPALLLSAAPGAAVVAAGALLWAAAATAAFQGGMVLPLFQPVAAALIALGGILGFRFVVADKDKRYLRQAFALYLPGPVVDRLVESAEPPALGGETRLLTVLFSDIKGFTSIAEGLGPEAVVRFLNRYLSVMSDTIEAHGGFVDKYIGDAVVAVFGAPLDDPDHARHAVEAALACQRNLDAAEGELGLPDGQHVATRIGINSGEMLVGNIGSSRRFNYTVMGDAVNLASRLEGANKVYGTSVLVSEETRTLCGGAPAFREIDRIRVMGRERPVTVYQPLDGPAGAPANGAFGAALTAFRSGDFDEARRAFGDAAAAGDTAARPFLERLDALGRQAPDGWDGVTDLDSK